MTQSLLFILMRWLHIGSMAVVMGGLVFILLSAGPARAWADRPEVALVIRKIEMRFRLALVISMFGLIISGVYQWVIFGQAYQEAGAIVLGLLAVKVLLAVSFFALVWAMHVELMVHPKARTWRIVNLSLVITVVMLAGVLRYLRLRHLGLP